MTRLLRRIAAAFIEPAAAPRPDERTGSGSRVADQARAEASGGRRPWRGADRPDRPDRPHRAERPHRADRPREAATAPRAVVFTPPRPSPTAHASLGARADAPAPEHDGRAPVDAPPVGPAVTGATVLAADVAAIPVAAACAGELRARAHAAAALLCVWRPAESAPPADGATSADDLGLPWDEPVRDPSQTPTGATTPAARRLATRLSGHDLAATACGRLAWLRLDAEPERAAAQTVRARAIVDVPVVLAVAGPRHAAFAPLIGDLGPAVAVLPTDAEPALRELVLATMPRGSVAIRAPLRPGPPRWAAMAGLGRLRSLGEDEA